MKKIFTLVCMLACSVCSVVQADDYIPLLEEGKEWGYVSYQNNYRGSIEFHPYSNLEYYRLCCGPKIDIDGKEYTQILRYKSFVMPENPEVVAYMREENGRVYRLYSTNVPALQAPYDLFSNYNETEYLLYDFNMNVGDTFCVDPDGSVEDVENPDSYTIVVKCVETGYLDTESGRRKYLKFDRSITSNIEFWMSYDYIVEGIGPIGNCDFTIPYREDGTSMMISHFFDIDFLYQRQISEKQPDGKCYQGDMIYKAPLFDVAGVYDPSVWFWPNSGAVGEQTANDTKEQDVRDLPDLSIYYRNGDWVASSDEDLTSVEITDVLGNVIEQYHPQSMEFKYYRDKYNDKTIIIHATTPGGYRYFKDLEPF